MNLIDSTKEDLKSIAICHRSAFPESLSSKMGVNYLEKMLEWYLVSPKGFMFHMICENEIVGYCGGIIVDGALSTGSASAMTQHSFNSAVKSFLTRPWLFFHPELTAKYKFVLRNIMYRFKKPAKTKVAIAKQSINPYAGLVVIGVNMNFHGIGYGSFLLEEFERKTNELGLKEMRLTVKSTNEKAIKSYLRNGWQKSKLQENSLQMIKILK